MVVEQEYQQQGLISKEGEKRFILSCHHEKRIGGYCVNCLRRIRIAYLLFS